MKDQTVLVTGAGGFIGSHLAEQLVQLGAKTRALVHYRGNGGWGWLDESPLKGEMQIIPGDIREMAQGDLRARIGFVPQKAVLFTGTVAANVRYGDIHVR